MALFWAVVRWCVCSVVGCFCGAASGPGGPEPVRLLISSFILAVGLSVFLVFFFFSSCGLIIAIPPLSHSPPSPRAAPSSPSCTPPPPSLPPAASLVYTVSARSLPSHIITNTRDICARSVSNRKRSRLEKSTGLGRGGGDLHFASASRSSGATWASPWRALDKGVNPSFLHLASLDEYQHDHVLFQRDCAYPSLHDRGNGGPQGFHSCLSATLGQPQRAAGKVEPPPLALQSRNKLVQLVRHILHLPRLLRRPCLGPTRCRFLGLLHEREQLGEEGKAPEVRRHPRVKVGLVRVLPASGPVAIGRFGFVDGGVDAVGLDGEGAVRTHGQERHLGRQEQCR